MTLRICLFICFFVVFSGFSQEKKRLSHDDYAGWNTISAVQLSTDGAWLLYEQNPQDGDGQLIIRQLLENYEIVVPRGQRAVISPGNKYVAFRISPEASAVRKAKVEKKKRDEMPVDSLAFFFFETRELVKYAALESFKFPKESSDWIAYVIDHARLVQETGEGDKNEPAENQETQGEPENKEAAGASSHLAVAEEDTIQKKTEKPEKPGKVLYVANPVTGDTLQVKNIQDYLISDHGALVAGLTETKKKDTLSTWQVFTVETKSLVQKSVDTRQGDIKQLNIDKEGTQLAWLFTADTTAQKSYAVYHYQTRRGELQKIIDTETSSFPAASTASEHRQPYFSDNGQRLFITTRPIPEVLPKDTLLVEEKYALDVWHWQDPMLQSQQKVMLNQLQRASYPAVYHLSQKSFVQLCDEDISTISLDEGNNVLQALGQSSQPYMVERQWTGGNARDLYLIDVTSGSRKLIAEKIESSAGISPAGKFIYWYDTDIQTWVVYNIGKDSKYIVSSIPYPLYNELNDLPMSARPYGIAGWTENDSELLVYDNYDVWKVDPDGRLAPESITKGHGREHSLRLRVQNLDRDEKFIRLGDGLIFSGFHELTMQSGFFRLQNGTVDTLIYGEASHGNLNKAKDADVFVFTKSTFTEFPDLWVSGMDFSLASRVSDANPQQADYSWGSVQLVEWLDFNNKPLQGLLYLPEDLDVGKSYPMLVYFYERSSQGLYQHFIPSPSRSTINRSYCTSNGYIVFVPDITYETGFPGESAYNAIVSGTKAMSERFPFIDRENMGLQGQSWGGYQIAYLVTRTNMFKAAMAGAPVSNMVSAYGGIRWQTGVNRQFQYEQTQSRIGGTLWEKPLRYIENSPVFFADKIETPLLIMHNDDDGAVPWYQGIELFTAMRRLSKPVWMLVYNGEAHNLTKWPNRMDLSVRMYQFFDYYLKGEPAPVWLDRGIPATEKGKYNRYELVE